LTVTIYISSKVTINHDIIKLTSVNNRLKQTQKAEEGRTTQTTVYPHVKASGKFPGKNPRAQKAHLYAFKETFLEK
jgi:hypothetical protein